MADGRSLREWTTDLGIQLRDTSGSQATWSFTERYLALQEGFRSAKGWFRVPDVYESLILTAGVREYGIPQYVRNVREVHRNTVITPQIYSSYIQWIPLKSWWVVPSPETNRLWIEGDYRGAAARLYYERDVEVPPVETSLVGNVTSTQSYIPVANTSDFKVWQWQQPGYVIIENEIIRYEQVTATSFTGLTRGAFNTAPQVNSLSGGLGLAHQSNQVITPFIVMPEGGALDQYINNVARAKLYEYRLNDADSEADRVVGTLAQTYATQAEEVRRRNRPFHWPKAAQQRFPPRR